MGVLDTTGNSESFFSLQVRGQEVSSAAQSPGLPAQQSCRDERGGGGGGGRRERGGNVQPDLTRVCLIYILIVILLFLKVLRNK